MMLLLFIKTFAKRIRSFRMTNNSKFVITPVGRPWIALTVRGGNCTFLEKVRNAQAAGAAAVVVGNFVPEEVCGWVGCVWVWVGCVWGVCVSRLSCISGQQELAFGTAVLWDIKL